MANIEELRKYVQWSFEDLVDKILELEKEIEEFEEKEAEAYEQGKVCGYDEGYYEGREDGLNENGKQRVIHRIV